MQNKTQFSDINDTLIKCVLPSDKYDNRTYICTYTKLGKGAYSKVYKGYIDHLDNDNDDPKEFVAIKKMNLEQIKAHDCLENEIDIMKQLDHPNILKMIDVVEIEEHNEKIIYIILEICGGGDLKKLVNKRIMKEKYAITYFKQIADGLQYLRQQKIIHRDLKPQNVLLSTDRKIIKIADFGFAKIIGNEALAETLCGSPLYMAPEILLKKPYTSKADLWSVGVMLYEVLCGRHPFKSVDSIVDLVHKVETDKIQFPHSAKISAPGIDLLKRLLKKNPYERIGWNEFFNHKWFRILSQVKQDNTLEDPQPISTHPINEDLNRTGSSTILFNSTRMQRRQIHNTYNTPSRISSTSSLPISIINNYSRDESLLKQIVMSPPSFINSPVVPNNSNSYGSHISLNVINNYQSESELKIPDKMQSMPILPFEHSSKNNYDLSGSISQHTSVQKSISDYLGTSIKMLKESLKSQSLH